jgi:diguanylate cyclase (GGDEF)-like protein
MCLALLQTSPRTALVAWTAAWVSLFVALMALLVAFRVANVAQATLPVYLFCEYVFGYLVFAGCREFATGQSLTSRDGWVALVLVVPAIALPLIGRWQFNVFYPFHSLLYACLFFAAWRQLARAKPSARGRVGLLVLKTALLVLTLLYAVYAPIFAAASLGWIDPNPAFLAFSPFYDMLALTLLGFGMVMMTSGDVHSDLEQARDFLAGVAHQDHLTSAFNRHAFYQVLDQDLTGTAVFADIDNLKSINDQFGHAAGDAAIRACATALRSYIRADDFLFRWGGDEFLVLLLGVPESEARRRMGDVNELLRGVQQPDAEHPMTVSMSMGFAHFTSAESLDEVIRVADTAMYGHKRNRR